MDEKKLQGSSDSEIGDQGRLVLNETGHVQELDRQFSLLSICSVGIVTGNAWAALGGSIVVAIYNGGPPGVIYEFIVVSFFYWLVAASLAELASSMPSSAGVYHWASITPGPKYGRVIGWFAGWWNTFAWISATATMSSICSNIAVAMYGLYHPGYTPERWHIFIGYLITTWIACCIVLFWHYGLPLLNNIGLFFILGGVLITVLVCAVMPSQTGAGYATSSFVWRDWVNETGYSSNSFVFLMGMLNGAYAIGVPDCVSHLCEELPNPKRNIPKAIAAQMIIGFLTTVAYMIAIFYAITDLDDVFAASYFPLAKIYQQATRSNAGTIGLLLIIFIPIFCTTIGSYITAGRCIWTLARDDAIPFSHYLKRISPRWGNPFNATLVCGIFSTILGAVYVGSSTAFNAFIGSSVVLTTLSYLAAILPFVFTQRFKFASFPLSEAGAVAKGNGMQPGPFQMNHVVGYVVNIVASAYIMVFVVIFCFPFTKHFDAVSMNYASAIMGGMSLMALVWWVVGSEGYVGPQAVVSGVGNVIIGEDVPRENALRGT
ncbi:amino acid/polyamine transporter I [Bisporella sp. PMI_857]|nr:amino acid/polyamine transporter I [Bisporella sp. PMI_857]